MFERMLLLVGETTLIMLSFFAAESILLDWNWQRPTIRKLSHSLIFGLASLLTIHFGLELEPGVIFDLRGGVIGLAFLVGGWRVGLSAAVAAFLTRWFMGGQGMNWGLIAITADFGAVAIALRFFRREEWSKGSLVTVGVLVGIIEALTLMPLLYYHGVSPWRFAYTAGLLFLFQSVGTIAVGAVLLIRRAKDRFGEQLKESEARFRRLVEMSPDMFYRFSTTRGAIYCSPQVETILGYSAESILQNPFGWKEKVHPDDLDQKLEQVAQVGPEKSFEVEYRFRDATGKWRWLRDRSIGISEFGSETIIDGIITDITDLRLQQRQFREMFNLVPELICQVDPAGNLLQINPAWEKQLGYAEAELIGHPVLEFIHPEDREITRGVGHEINSGRRVQGFINRYRCKGGIYRHIEWTATKMQDSHQRLGIGRDVTDRLRAEAEIRAAHERMKCLINNIPDPLWLKDSDGRYLAVNEAWKRIMMVESQEVVGKTARDLFSPELAERFEEEDRGMMESGAPIQMIEMISTPKGSTEHYEAWKQAVRIGSDERFGTVGCARNITARLQMESKLAKYKLLADVARDVIFFIDPETGHIVDANASAFSSYGYDRQELLSLSVFDLRCDAPEKVQQDLSEAVRNGGRFELDHRRKDGSRFPVEVVVHPGYINGEKLLVSVIRDITYRRKFENELRRLNTELEGRVELKTREALELYHNAPCGYHAINASGIIEQMNARELTWLGYLESEVINKMAFIDLLLPEDAAKFMEIFPRFIESGDRSTAQWRMRRKDGSTFPVFVTVQAIRDVGGRFIKTQTIVIDISEREQIEEHLRKARDAAEAANKAKTAFLANISHELRTPLNAIIGFSDVLQKDAALAPKSREHVRTISRSGQHLIEIIGDVLEMARIEAGNVALRSVRFDLESVLEDIQHFFLESINAKGLALDMELFPENPGSLLGDVTKVRQVLINLVGNAVKFTTAGTISVRIGWVRDAEGNCQVRGEVADTGPGIQPEDIGQLFKPFYQTELGYTAKGGTGLGLRITREYLQRMGGDISVSSEPGGGTSFQFHLQLKFATSARHSPSHVTEGDLVQAQSTPAKAVRVLVVDDDPDNRKLFLNILEPLGYVLVEAVDGLDALEKITKFEAEVILMDLHMPRMDGCQAIREIRRIKGSKVVIVAVSASVVSEKFRAAREAGADACLAKPFKDVEVLRLMSRGSETLPPDSGSSGSIRCGGLGESILARSILKLSPEQTQGLISAAQNAEYRKLTALVDEIREADPELASGLGSRVEAFDYDSILELLKPTVS